MSERLQIESKSAGVRQRQGEIRRGGCKATEWEVTVKEER